MLWMRDNSITTSTLTNFKGQCLIRDAICGKIYSLSCKNVDYQQKVRFIKPTLEKKVPGKKSQKKIPDKKSHFHLVFVTFKCKIICYKEVHQIKQEKQDIFNLYL